jgi:hypothetical protein
MAVALRDAGHWAEIVDRNWNLVYSTDELRRIYGGLLDLGEVAVGAHFFGPEAMRTRLNWRSGRDGNVVPCEEGRHRALPRPVVRLFPLGRSREALC